MKCLICDKTDSVKFLDDYRLEIKEDKDYFKNAKIYRCEECNFAFTHPMPPIEKLDHFYKYVYRANGRPPYLVSENYEDQIKHYLEDKNLSYLLYLTTLIDVKKVKNYYDFGSGDGDLGYALKKKFPQLNLHCTEGDNECEKILSDRGYINYKDLNTIDKKFDLIVTTHSLEHLTEINSIFSKFNEILSNNGFVFFEVPNCTQEYWNGRPYDGPHLLFYTKKSFEILAKKNGFNILNFSYSAYSFAEDHKNQRDSQNLYYKGKSKPILLTLKKLLKKILPKKLVSFRQDFLKIKNIRSDNRMNWYVNNNGDNCYIRGVLQKKI